MFVAAVYLRVQQNPNNHVSVTRAAKADHATPAQVALAWLLKKSPVILPIPGTSTVKHLEENCAAAGVELMAEQMREFDQAA